MANRWGNNGNSNRLHFLGAPKSLQMVTVTMKIKDACSLEKKKNYDKPRQHFKKQRHYLTDKGPSSQSYGFSSSHVGIWELDHKEGWVPKNWCFQTVLLEKTLESPLDCNEIKQVNPKRNQSWVFIGRTDAEAEAPILWCEELTHWKRPDAGKDWRQEEKGMTEDEMVEWHHRLNGHEFEQAPGDGEGQGSLECCSPWDCKESDMAERLNNNNKVLHNCSVFKIIFSIILSRFTPTPVCGFDWLIPFALYL